MKIVNPHLAQNIHDQGMIVPPNEFGYIHLAGEIETPFILKKDSHQKKQLIRKLKNLCNELDNTTDVIRRTDIFTAIIVPSGSGEGRKFREEKELDFHVATFDLVILIECKRVQDIDQIIDCELYKIIEGLLKSNSTYFNRTLAKNSNRIAEVDKDTQGIFCLIIFLRRTLKRFWMFGNTRQVGGLPKLI